MYDEEIYEKAMAMGLQPRRTPKGYSILCPRHEDNHHSAVVYSNDGWAQCFGTCGRWNFLGHHADRRTDEYEVKIKEESDGGVFIDYYDYWLTLDPLEQDIKGIPASFLNALGWRKLQYPNKLNLPAGIFIPAFNAERTQINFCQVRHEEGNRRFSFPSGVQQSLFGLESLDSGLGYIAFTEGNSDRATLEYCGISAIALPSGSSGKLLKELGRYALDNGLLLVSVSDNDAVGDNILKELTGVYPFIDARVSDGFKDINDYYNAFGREGVREKFSWLLKKN